MVSIAFDEFDSPLGKMSAFVVDGALCHLDFSDCDARIQKLLNMRFSQISFEKTLNPLGIRDCLTSYFSGARDCFDRITLETGGTDFQQKVWSALQDIPYGNTHSYSDLAEAIGQPTAMRAVASANARNPISIIIPCHRVIAKSGALAGYAGGVDRKEYLLSHENPMHSFHSM